jgi:hypothetical protein
LVLRLPYSRLLRRPEACRSSLASVGSTGARAGRSGAFKLANANSRIGGGFLVSDLGTGPPSENPTGLGIVAVGHLRRFGRAPATFAQWRSVANVANRGSGGGSVRQYLNIVFICQYISARHGSYPQTGPRELARLISSTRGPQKQARAKHDCICGAEVWTRKFHSAMEPWFVITLVTPSDSTETAGGRR